MCSHCCLIDSIGKSDLMASVHNRKTAQIADKKKRKMQRF
jgi:hypothetical protein